jgi:hypothetical protein
MNSIAIKALPASSLISRVSRNFVGQKLEGHETMEMRVFCFVHHALATGTEFLDDVIVRDRQSRHCSESLA